MSSRRALLGDRDQQAVVLERQARVDALGGAALDDRVDGRVELDRELAHDRLLVQQLDAVERRQLRAGVGGALEQQLAQLDQARGGRASSGRSTPASALSACAVQMLCVAFSRRMCCSRVCSVSTKPRRPSTSVVSPAMRPGMRRR